MSKRERADELVRQAIKNGGTTPRNPRHMGSMDGGRVCRTVFDARILFSGHLY